MAGGRTHFVSHMKHQFIDASDVIASSVLPGSVIVSYKMLFSTHELAVAAQYRIDSISHSKIWGGTNWLSPMLIESASSTSIRGTRIVAPSPPPPSPPPHIIIRTRPFEEWEFSVSVYEGIPYELEMAGEPSLNGQTVRFVPTTAGAACDWDAQTSAGMYGADPLVGGRMVVQLAYQSSGYYLCHRTTPGVPWVAQDHVTMITLHRPPSAPPPSPPRPSPPPPLPPPPSVPLPIPPPLHHGLDAPSPPLSAPPSVPASNSAIEKAGQNTTTPFEEPATSYAVVGFGTLLLLMLPIAAYQVLRMRRAARLGKLAVNHRKTLSTRDIELSPGQGGSASTVGIDISGMAKPQPPRPSASMTRTLSRAMSGIKAPSKEEAATLVTSSTSSESIAADLPVDRQSLSTTSFGVPSAGSSFLDQDGESLDLPNEGHQSRLQRAKAANSKKLTFNNAFRAL